MSTVFQIKCMTCGKKGPKLRRTVGGRGVVHAADLPATEEGKAIGESDLGDFLAEHEFHELIIERGP